MWVGRRSGTVLASIGFAYPAERGLVASGVSWVVMDDMAFRAYAVGTSQLVRRISRNLGCWECGKGRP
jgi:hypothetical protein